jgi:ribosomal protein S18 acetylase RimI-like enzyme
VRQDVRVRRLVRPAAPTDRERILDVTTSAFVTEPAFAHFFADSYDAHARTFLGFLVDLRLAGGLVWVEEVDGAVVAVSMWDPPGGPRLDAYDAAVHDLAPPGDHFYLGVIASDPEARGRGHGSAVLLPGLGAADAAGLPTYLETGTEGNVGFYTRFGFDVSHELDLGDGTRIWCLTRPPAASSG